MSATKAKIYDFADFRLIPNERLLLRAGSQVSLRPKAFSALVLLIERRGHLVEKKELIEHIWESAFVEEAAVSRCVWAIRHALGEDPKHPEFIQTVARSGYRFIGEVESYYEDSGDSLAITENGGAEETLGPFNATDVSVDNTRDLTLPERSPSPDGGQLRLTLKTVVLLVVLGLIAAVMLPLQLSLKAPGSSSAETRVDPAAADAYGKGRFYYESALNDARPLQQKELFSKAASEFQRSIAVEPQYARAYGSLARVYHFQGSLGEPAFYAMAKEAALRAIAIDSGNPEAHSSLAWVYWRADWDWPRAEKEFKLALERGGVSEGSVVHGYALFLSAMGRHKDATEKISLHEESNPLSIMAKVNSANIRLRARDYAQAELNFRRVLEVHPSHPAAAAGLSICLTGLGRFDEAIEAAKLSATNGNQVPQRLTLAWVYARAGHSNEARELLEKAKREFLPENAHSEAIPIAKVHAGLGEIDQAFEWLEKAFAVRSQYLVLLQVSPEFDNLHGDARFTAMVKRLGIPN